MISPLAPANAVAPALSLALSARISALERRIEREPRWVPGLALGEVALIPALCQHYGPVPPPVWQGATFCRRPAETGCSSLSEAVRASASFTSTYSLLRGCVNYHTVEVTP